MAKTRRPPPATNLNSFLTVGEAAEYLGVTVWTLRHWDRGGKLTPARHPLNGYRLYRKEDLDALLRRVAPPGKAAARRTNRP